MLPVPSESLDYASLWTWFLLFVRTEGVFFVLPGVGTEHVPEPVRASIAMIVAATLVVSGVHVPLPGQLIDGGIMVFSEFVFGYIIGALPTFVLGGVAVAGQVIAGSIGLAQANMIDPSLGELVSIVARLKIYIGTAIFLAVDGHHILLRAIAGEGSVPLPGVFRPDYSTAMLFLDRLQSSFDLAVSVSAPVLVTMLVTQFTLGLLTRAVPQVNVFIISLPLTLGLGLFIIVFTMPTLVARLTSEFSYLEDSIAKLVGS